MFIQWFSRHSVNFKRILLWTVNCLAADHMPFASTLPSIRISRISQRRVMSLPIRRAKELASSTRAALISRFLRLSLHFMAAGRHVVRVSWSESDWTLCVESIEKNCTHYSHIKKAAAPSVMTITVNTTSPSVICKTSASTELST